MMGGLHLAYVALFCVAAGGCFWSAYRIRSLETSLVRRPLTVFLVATGLWALATVPLLLPVSRATMYASYLFGLVVGISTVVVWLWFCSAYAGHPYHLDTRLQLAAVAFVSAVVTLKLTNPLHGAYFESAVSTEPFVHFAPTVGLLYWFVTTVAYVAAGVGLYLLFETYYRSNYGAFRLGLLTAAIGLPVVPQLAVVWWPDAIPLLYYEPVGAAIFAVGVVTVAREEFFAVHTPARPQLLDRLPDLIIVTDRNDRIVDYNHSATELVPTLPERVGDPLSEVLPEVADADGTTVDLRLELETRTYRVGRESVSIGAETVGYTIVLSDITELEEQRFRLERQTEHIQDVTEAIAHELRNPLGILIGNLKRLEDEAEGTADGADNLRTAISAAERINVVTDDLIAILRYGTPITESERVRLIPLLETARSDAAPDCTLTAEPASDAEILAEGTRCAELFRLLFRLSQQRGATTIDVRRNGTDTLVVSSDGESFSTDDSDSLFKYGREAGEESRMLLANAWTLATLHGWSITASGAGERLSIRLGDVAFAQSGAGDGTDSTA